jgi:hypothetical protein
MVQALPFVLIAVASPPAYLMPSKAHLKKLRNLGWPLCSRTRREQQDQAKKHAALKTTILQAALEMALEGHDLVVPMS